MRVDLGGGRPRFRKRSRPKFDELLNNLLRASSMSAGWFLSLYPAFVKAQYPKDFLVSKSVPISVSHPEMTPMNRSPSGGRAFAASALDPTATLPACSDRSIGAAMAS